MKKRNRIIGKSVISFFLAATMVFGLCGCSKDKGKNPAEEHVSAPDETDDNYRVFYEIFTGSFSDSNGDGKGDLKGIINRLDYLNDGDVNSEESLGIQGIWLTPIFSSPSYHKYDVMNYYKIDSSMGTEEDLKELLEKCHERNVKVILDLVINHTSNQNTWFSSFVAAHKSGDTEDEFYDFYSWCKKSDCKGGVKYNKIQGTTDEFYECNFSPDMPELNYDNEKVREEMLKVAKYYLDLGVDGFRFDAVKYIYYNDTTRSADFWKWYVGELKAYKEDIYTVGECWSGETETLAYVEAGLNCFNFQTSQPEGHIANAVKSQNINSYASYIERYQDAIQKANADGMMCNFISNHDMDRASGYLPPDMFRAQMAANLYLLCSGSPYLYYGEEIGIKGTRGSANTDANRRLAMLWGDGDSISDPVGTSYSIDGQINGTVADQKKDENSLFHYYCKVLTIRNRNPEIPRGDYKAVQCGSKEFGGFEITYNGATSLLLHNLSTEEKEIDLSEITGITGEYSKIAEYIGMDSAKLDGTKLVVGPQTSVLIK